MIIVRYSMKYYIFGMLIYSKKRCPMSERKIAIVPDAPCDLPHALRAETHIHVVPMRIVYETR